MSCDYEEKLYKTLEDLQRTIHFASQHYGHPLRLTIPSDGCAVLLCDSQGELCDGRLPIAMKLTELATPPKPKTVTITIEAPYEWAKTRGLWHSQTRYGDATDALIGKACEEAVKPFEE